MSKQILSIVGNFLVITNQDTGAEKDIPLGQCRSEYQGDDVYFITTSHTARDAKILSYRWQDLLDGEAGDTPFADLDSVKAWIRTKTGFRAAGSSAIPTNDVFTGGAADYNHSGSVQNVLAANNPTVLENDGAGAFTNTNFLPAGVTSIWDVINDTFDWSQLKLGDMIDIRIDVEVTTLSPNTDLSINLRLGTGPGEYVIPFITLAEAKAIGTYQLNRFNGIYLGDANTLDNGGQFEINTSADCNVKVNGWYMKIIRKGI